MKHVGKREWKYLATIRKWFFHCNPNKNTFCDAALSYISNCTDTHTDCKNVFSFVLLHIHMCEFYTTNLHVFFFATVIRKTQKNLQENVRPTWQIKIASAFHD